MRDKILNALSRTYGFNGWKFENEFEFKHELFHQLARIEVDGTPLSKRTPGTPSCRLHAEGKVLNGNRLRADLLICDPFRTQKNFNYEVEYVLELKHQLTERHVADEMAKFRSYGRSFEGYFLAANNIARTPITNDFEYEGKPHLIHRNNLPPAVGDDFVAKSSRKFDNVLEKIRLAVDDTLLDYGHGKQQYQSFFWCNYEHEESRHHSFPSEGDFNAHFYHRLRMTLPKGVEIRSEVNPPGLPQRRIDFVVRDSARTWAIPIEVKMNWDQFKPAYKAGVLQPDQASLILDRLDSIRRSYHRTHPIVVVIQGAWQIIKRNIRARAMPVLENADFLFEYVSFDEEHDRIDRRQLGCVHRT